MKVLLVNKSADNGGAAIACARLLNSLNRIPGVDVKLMVQRYSGNNSQIFSSTNSLVKGYLDFLRFVWERLSFLPYEKAKKVRFAFSLANTGEDISNHEIVKSADVIHLHWINQGFLSLHSLKKLFQLGKPVVWTLHDMWPFTGGCHYSGDCINYKLACGNCYYLKNPDKTDLSNRLFREKEKILKNINLTLVGCSQWMAEKAKESSLLKNFRIESIPNPIDVDLFSPGNKEQARRSLGLPIDKKIILFGAGNIYDERKGFHYLLRLLEKIKSNYPTLAGKAHCVIFGKAKHPYTLALDSTNINYVGSQAKMIEIYRSADVFVLPSLQDNLPNTVMEAMSCGIPVAAFNTGGLSEMIDHKLNGYLAYLYNDNDLAGGLNYILTTTDYSSLQLNARKKVIENYHPDIIAEKYSKLYNELLKK